MRRKLRSLAVILGATTVLYLSGTALIALTPPPWGWVWIVPLAIIAGAACRLVEWPRERRERRRNSGRCERCAYDLRATPHQCPECGRTTW